MTAGFPGKAEALAFRIPCVSFQMYPAQVFRCRGSACQPNATSSGKGNKDRIMGLPGSRPDNDRQNDAANEWAALTGPLRDVGEIACLRFGAALAEALSQAAAQLSAQGAQAAATLEQAALLEAAHFAQTRQRSLAEDFRKHFERRYARACRPTSTLMTGYALDFDVSQLRIVSHELLEETLDPSMLAEAIRNRCAGSLHELAKPFRDLLDDRDLQPGDIPPGPKTVARALADALNGQFSRIETKQRVARALCRHFPEPIDRVYRDLRAHLDASFDIVPALRAASIRDQPSHPDSVGASASPTVPLSLDGAEATGSAPIEKHALEAAQAAVEHSIACGRLPRSIAAFLSGPWRLLLARLHQDQGPHSPEWNRALRTMDDLVWSLSVRTAREERDRLVRTLPDLVKRLGEGLDRLGTPEDARAPFFASLAKYHLKLVTLAGLVAGVGPASAVPASASSQLPAATPPRDAADHGDAGLDSLATGDWIEIVEADGTRMELKVAWVSAGSKLFLLTNRQGKRALSLNATELAERLRQGSARRLAPHSALATNTPNQGKKTA